MSRRYPALLIPFLRRYRSECEHNADYRTIAKAFKVGIGTAHRWLALAEADGLLTRDPGKARAYRLTPQYGGLALIWRDG